MKQTLALKISRTALTGALLFTHVLFAHQAEAGFWAQRAEAVNRMRRGATADLGSGQNREILSVPLVSGQILKGAALSAFAAPSYPPRLQGEAADLLTALLPRANLRSYTYAGPGTALLIHFQDVHGHAGAQRNIAALLTELIARRPHAPIVLEGGAGPIARPALGSASAEAIRRTAAFFFNSGTISGAEVAVLTAPLETPFFGGEDADLYQANVTSVRDAALRREELIDRLTTRLSRAEIDADQLFNPSLQTLNEKSRQWASGADGLIDRVLFLWDRAGSTNSPQIKNFMEASQIEKGINLALVQRDRNALLAALEDRLSQSDTTGLTEAALAFRSGVLRPRDFYRTLRETLHRTGLDWERYPAFNDYTRYAILADEIRPESLHQEMETLESSLWDQWARTPEERDHVTLLRDLRLTLGLAALALTPEEWETYSQRSEEIHCLPERWRKTAEEANPSLPEWTSTLAPFEQFYKLAEARNFTLAKNVISVLPERFQRRPLAVLVAGGFHSAGLASLMARRHVSVLTLSPKLEESGSGTPFDLFTRDKTPLEQLFASPRISLSDTLALQPIGEGVNPRAEMVRLLTPRLAHLLTPTKRGARVNIDDGNPRLVSVREPALSPTDLTHLANGGTVLASNVATSLNKEESEDDPQAPRIYVFSQKETWSAHWVQRLNPFWRGVKQVLPRLFGVALLAAFLLPLTPSPSAHAATFFNSGQSVQFTVQRGEHLWGVAQQILAANRVKATNQAISHMVEDLSRVNKEKITNPNLIYPIVAYNIPKTAVQEPTGDDRETVAKIPPDATDSLIEEHVKTLPQDTVAIPPLHIGSQKGEPVPNEPREITGEPIPSSKKYDGYDVRYFLLMAGIMTLLAKQFLASSLFPVVQSSAKQILAFQGLGQKIVAQSLAKWRSVLPYLGISIFLSVIYFLWPDQGAISGLVGQTVAFLSSSTMETIRTYLSHQWPVEVGWAVALSMASYFIWWRAKEVDLGSVEKTDPRLMDWISKLEIMDGIIDPERLESDSLLPLLNNLQALILNHQLTGASLADRGMVEKQIEIYRSISRLSRDTVHFLDRRLQNAHWEHPGTRERIMDIREKIFLYQLYALKVSHSLVNASVAHWAFSNFDNRSSWFERWWLGFILRSVRGVRPMIDKSTAGFNRNMLQDNSGAGDRLWDRAPDFSAVRLGNTLIPGLYSDEKKALLSTIFTVLAEKSKSKHLSDMTVKDLHRKGLSTMMGLLFWGVTISVTLSFGQALLAFLTGLGANMALFRLQAAGTRRDSFYRKGLAEWKRNNVEKLHPNGRLRSDGTLVTEDPFHLGQDSLHFNFHKAQAALQGELEASAPSADMILLVARNKSEQIYYEDRAKDPRLFRQDVPVIVRFVPENQGSLPAFAEAALFPSSDEFTLLATRFPHLRGRSPWDLRIGTLVSKNARAEEVAMPLRDLNTLKHHISPEVLGETTVLKLGIMNLYRATQESARKGFGGMAFRWADRAYIGPIRTGEGPGITLDTFWANKGEMEQFKFGAVVATPGKPIKLIRMNGDENTFRVLKDKHPGRVYDSTNPELDQYQGFSGEGFYTFDEAGSRAQTKFFKGLLKRYDHLPTKPPLDLLMNFLIPAQIARRHRETPGLISQKIVTYFAQNGFLSDISQKSDLDKFNLRNANKAKMFGEGDWTIGLNANPVEGFFYGGGPFSIESVDENQTNTPPSLRRRSSFRFLAAQAAEAMLIPWTVMSTFFSHWTPRGIVAALSVPLISIWLLLSPAGLMASRVSVAEETLARSLLRNQGMELPIKLQGTAIPSSPKPQFFDQDPTEYDRQTVRAWSQPEKDLLEIMKKVSDLRKTPAPGDEQARRALARLGLILIAATPLQNNLLEGFDVDKTRRILQRAAPGDWAGDRKEENLQGAAGIIRRTALRSLAHQVAELQRGRSTGNPLEPAVEQSAYLAGMAGLPERAMEDLRYLVARMGKKDQMETVSNIDWENAVERGRTKRDFLLTRSTQNPVPSRSPESTFTALRVTELMPAAPGSAASRRALFESLKQRSTFRGTTRDVLVVNGNVAIGRDESALREILRERLNKYGIDSYLATVQIVALPEDRFSPEKVLNQLPREFSSLSMDLVTVNPAAVLVDPLRSGTPYRVLFLELFGGELIHVDLLNLARQTFQAARVVATGA